MNMFGLRFASESRKRTKNGQPPHSTTGDASASSSHDRTPAGTTCAKRGHHAAHREHQQRDRRRDADPEPARHVGELRVAVARRRVTVSGSSAMPQIGQAPGPSRTISGCIGHVHFPAAGAGDCAAAGAGGVAGAPPAATGSAPDRPRTDPGSAGCRSSTSAPRACGCRPRSPARRSCRRRDRSSPRLIGYSTAGATSARCAPRASG